MFGGELGGLLDARSHAVTSLVAELVQAVRDVDTDTVLLPVDASGAIKGYAGGQPTGPPAPSIAWRLGVDLEQVAEVAGALEVMAYASTADRVLVDLEAYAQTVAGSPKLGVILRPIRPDCDSPANLLSKIEVASTLGFDRVDFYHYGLAPIHALDWIKFALGAGAADASNSKER
jgi:hypothetical protein